MTMKSISLISFTQLGIYLRRIKSRCISGLAQTDVSNRRKTVWPVFARYKKPAVQYESPSVYALAILFFINQNEDKTVIKALYDRMNDFEILIRPRRIMGIYERK